MLENRSTGTFETIVLEGDSYTQIEEQVDQAEVDQQLQQIARRMDADELAHVREALDDRGIRRLAGRAGRRCQRR